MRAVADEKAITGAQHLIYRKVDLGGTVFAA
jgi:hypothetical protein